MSRSPTEGETTRVKLPIEDANPIASPTSSGRLALLSRPLRTALRTPAATDSGGSTTRSAPRSRARPQARSHPLISTNPYRITRASLECCIKILIPPPRTSATNTPMYVGMWLSGER